MCFLLSVRWWTWVQKPANPKYNAQYVTPEHRAVMEPVSHRKPVFNGNLLHFFSAVNVGYFGEDSSTCQPVASQHSTQILEIYLGTLELLSWNISSFSWGTMLSFQFKQRMWNVHINSVLQCFPQTIITRIQICRSMRPQSIWCCFENNGPLNQHIPMAQLTAIVRPHNGEYMKWMDTFGTPVSVILAIYIPFQYQPCLIHEKL